jgi:hypothetical protein
MKFTTPIAGFLAGIALAGCVNNVNYQDSTASPEIAAYPSVDSSFLSAAEWRFVGPYRGSLIVDPVEEISQNPHRDATGGRTAAPGGIRRFASLTCQWWPRMAIEAAKFPRPMTNDPVK